jgi:hypothetical protein
MFSYDIQTSIDIEAEPGAIWQVLTDFNSYGDWNPMLRNVQTDLQRYCGRAPAPLSSRRI